MENIYVLSDFSIKSKIGEKIKSIRLKQNITQKDLAILTEISLSAIKKIEKGELKSFDHFLKVLRILGKLETLQRLVEPEEISPNDYYQILHDIKKKERKRARGKLKNQPNKDMEW